MDLNALLTPVTQENADMSDPAQHLAWALQFFPAPNQETGEIPIHPVVRGKFSKLLRSFGFRHHPEDQTSWLIPGDHPEAGYMNVPKVVDKLEYDRWHAEHADPEAEAEKWVAKAEELLGTLDPKMLSRIRAMTPEQKTDAREVQRDQLPAALSRLIDLAEQHRADPDADA